MPRAGFYRDVNPEDYHADPAPLPSLSQGIAKLLIHNSPLHAWTCHPRLNPDFLPDSDKKFDLGNAAHKLLIGAGKNIAVLEFEDYRTNKAKDARDAAIAEGKSPILGHQYARATRMVDAGREQIAIRYENLHRARIFDPDIGAGEVVMLWKDDETWARQMLDWLSDDHLIYADYKTTAESAAPHTLGRKMSTDGWHIQAAMAERGLNTLDVSAPPRHYFFVVQEIEPPYALSIAELDENALVLGRKQLAYAFALWGACQKSNLWPGYPLDTVYPVIPPWFESEWLSREIHFAASNRISGNGGMVDQIV
jgi:hypothetical protein